VIGGISFGYFRRRDFITFKVTLGNCFENRPNTTDRSITNLVKNATQSSRNNKNFKVFVNVKDLNNVLLALPIMEQGISPDDI
jgi:hypothetical protein